ncbi:C4b-binding protein alpha chain-like [Manis pentadactyla]|uniref:C4b-binding protein alpha chain-like n=1 Tax=Manis pentadactyla TaxID=143292 RepID=UPI00255C4AE9|nr:C4b-binding protein alpha chain-like [Manis pentadactyla]KAI5168887.1 C4B-Binding Protein Alpha Chain [Manis pentadactyla]
MALALCLKPKIESGNLSGNKDQYVDPENATVQCDSGYRVIGSPSIICSENGTWYPGVPTCEWDTHKGCEQVLAGRKLMQRLPSPEDMKLALELYKLALEIGQLGRRET